MDIFSFLVGNIDKEETDEKEQEKEYCVLCLKYCKSNSYFLCLPFCYNCSNNLYNGNIDIAQSTKEGKLVFNDELESNLYSTYASNEVLYKAINNIKQCRDLLNTVLKDFENEGINCNLTSKVRKAGRYLTFGEYILSRFTY